MSTSRPSASKSTFPSASNGVTKATIEPSSFVTSMSYSFPASASAYAPPAIFSATCRPSAVASSVAT